MTIRTIIVLAALALAAPFAHADAKSKALKLAAKHAKQAASDAAAGFKSALRERRDQLFEGLDEFDAEIATLPFDVNRLGAIGLLLLFFHLDVREDALQAVDAFSAALIAETAAALAAGAARSELPDEFLYGRGGAIDDLGAAMNKAADKTLKSVRKRLAKTAKRARADAATDFTFRVERPFQYFAPLANETAVSGDAVDVSRLAIDLILARSALADDVDAVVIVAGFGAPSDGDIKVTLLDHFGQVFTDPSPSGTNGRFASLFSSIPEGNFAVAADVPMGASSGMILTSSIR